jgi:hypothetical protein
MPDKVTYHYQILCLFFRSGSYPENKPEQDRLQNKNAVILYFLSGW